MAQIKPRLVRLTAIITQLQSKRIVTANDIARIHNISIRTVYRDIRTLEESGIPIITEDGKGYSIMDGYKLPPVMFTQEETYALITAEQLVLKNKDISFVEHYKSAVMKLKSIHKNSQKIKTEFLSSRIQIRNNLESENTSNYLIQLQSAIINFRIIEINYLSLENQKSRRKVEPFAVYTTKENWILIAFCRKRNDFRAFRLDRIEKMQIENAHFEPHKITLEEYLEECRRKCESTPDIPLS